MDATLEPTQLALAPARQHRSIEQKPKRTGPLPPLAPFEVSCHRPPSLSQSEYSEGDSKLHVTLVQQGGAARDTRLTSGRPISAKEAAASSSSSAANATQTLLQMWTNPMQPPVYNCLPSLEDLACGNITGLRPQAITKAQLDIARPLQQVSRQFVPLVCGRTVAIMDQHAAAERVRLEQLQHEVYGKHGNPKQTDSLRLQPAHLLQLSPAEQQVLQDHRALLEAWGWRFAVSESGHAARHLVTHAATVLGTPLNSTELQSFLQQLKQTNGVARVPQAVQRLLISKACHSAIRFGDVLSAEQCDQLVKALRNTMSWHCCAHGRPTIMPLVDVASLQSLLQLRGKEC